MTDSQLTAAGVGFALLLFVIGWLIWAVVNLQNEVTTLTKWAKDRFQGQGSSIKAVENSVENLASADRKRRAEFSK